MLTFCFFKMEDYGVEITVCSDSMMRKLYLGGKGKSKSTDVLAFATIGVRYSTS